MKSRFISISVFASIFALIALTNCGQKDHQNHASHDEGAAHDHEKVEEAKLSLDIDASDYNLELEGTPGMLETYYFLKDALVATDADIAKKAAKLLAEKSEGEIKSAAEKIISSEDVETQRAEFENISKELFEKVKNEGENSEEVYQQYCPMAFDNKGAFWLSKKEEVKNPYFGDKMLNCGYVKETLAAN
ncbi:DUF3347 domain-containing protein [Flexithrix dorotheae]|uniref:DUF3347 domain-containing protein n=1 Tax=Flexithrix dorotheae TaxID=70993 RepID=UPI000372E384|nr:DUF3347 domain-containing protein [Flexithrix dorotheae]